MLEHVSTGSEQQMRPSIHGMGVYRLKTRGLKPPKLPGGPDRPALLSRFRLDV